jgi:hypothetical protein
MKLLDDIIDMASDDKEPIGNLLRKCLVLERQLKNEKLKAWVDQELDGYNRDREEDFPSYRVFHCVNKGDFHGLTVKASGHPFSLAVLSPEHRKMMEKVHLHQPAAAYDGRGNKTDDAALPWNQTMVSMYSQKIFQNGEPALLRAWQEIPGSILVSLLEQVRTRVLRFALDLKDSLPDEATSASSIPNALVDSSVVNNIFGGNVLIASHAENFTQISQTNVTEGNFDELEIALANLGITKDGIAALRSDIANDRKDGQATIGPKTKEWLADVGKYMVKEGAKAGFDVAKKAATKWVMQHYGLGV